MTGGGAHLCAGSLEHFLLLRFQFKKFLKLCELLTGFVVVVVVVIVAVLLLCRPRSQEYSEGHCERNIKKSSCWAQLCCETC